VERIIIDPATFTFTLYDQAGQALSKQRLLARKGRREKVPLGEKRCHCEFPAVGREKVPL
jgi:hypothetical protein